MPFRKTSKTGSIMTGARGRRAGTAAAAAGAHGGGGGGGAESATASASLGCRSEGRGAAAEPRVPHVPAVDEEIARLQAHPTLPAGTRVELHGLQSAVHLNGRAAHVLGLNADSGRLTVELMLAQEEEAYMQRVKETNIRALDPLPRTADALAAVLASARAGARVSIPAGKYLPGAHSRLEIPTALTVEGHKAELHFAVSVSAQATGALLQLSNFSVVNAPLTVTGKNIKQAVLQNITVSLPPHSDNDALTLNDICQHAIGPILLDTCTVRGGAESVFINACGVHLKGCHISGAASRGVFANYDFVIQDSVVTNCGGYGMKTRAGCQRRGNNSIQAGPWDGTMQSEQGLWGCDGQTFLARDFRGFDASPFGAYAHGGEDQSDSA